MNIKFPMKVIFWISANQCAPIYAAVHDLIVNFMHPGTYDLSKSLWNFVQTLDECNACYFISSSSVFFAWQLVLWIRGCSLQTLDSSFEFINPLAMVM